MTLHLWQAVLAIAVVQAVAVPLAWRAEREAAVAEEAASPAPALAPDAPGLDEQQGGCALPPAPPEAVNADVAAMEAFERAVDAARGRDHTRACAQLQDIQARYAGGVWAEKAATSERRWCD
jgi:hypothetical protein